MKKLTLYIAMRNARYRKNLTQEQIAHILGVSQACYNRWENGKRPISAEKLIFLIEFHYDDTEFLQAFSEYQKQQFIIFCEKQKITTEQFQKTNLPQIMHYLKLLEDEPLSDEPLSE